MHSGLSSHYVSKSGLNCRFPEVKLNGYQLLQNVSKKQVLLLFLMSHNGLYNSLLALTLHFRYLGRSLIEFH